jgi:hypothetical protein
MKPSKEKLVLSYGGSAGAAYGIHGTTAAVVAMTG